jgi:FkbM family methyltransferase
MNLKNPKLALKAFLEKNGWYVRKTKGLAAGFDCFHELRHRFNADVKTVFDIGAHHGETTFAILERFPNAVVYAFEPVGNNFEILQAAIRHLPNVVCHRLAFSDRAGTVIIVLQQDSQTHTLKRQVAIDGSSKVPTARVDVSTLDAFLRDRAVGAIDLLKVDVEGYELNVLSGGRETFSKTPPRFVLLEATLDPADNIHSPLVDIAAHLSAYRYRLLSIYDQIVWPTPSRLAYFNALFGLDTCL